MGRDGEGGGGWQVVADRAGRHAAARAHRQYTGEGGEGRERSIAQLVRTGTARRGRNVFAVSPCAVLLCPGEWCQAAGYTGVELANGTYRVGEWNSDGAAGNIPTCIVRRKCSDSLTMGINFRCGRSVGLKVIALHTAAADEFFL